MRERGREILYIYCFVLCVCVRVCVCVKEIVTDMSMFVCVYIEITVLHNYGFGGKLENEVIKG